jgi:beta-galactosidase
VANLVRRLAERYRDHPALALWHVNNEYGCHVAECYCEESARAFRRWLRRRYGTLEALNEAWGTAFWSQDYGDWDEISPPRRAPTYVNPTQQLDFRRFSSDALLECFELEVSVLREVTPGVPVTTNFMGFFKPLDYWRWARAEDVVSHDSYPDPLEPYAAADAAASYDLMRSLGEGRPWLLMEQTPSGVDWRAANALKRPGQMRLWSYQAIARGADGVMFFQWRAQRFGAHKFHGAMVPHGGTETRVWQEVSELGRELRHLDPVLGSAVPAAAAIALDWESWWALELETAKPWAALRLLDRVAAFYRPLHAANVPVDFVRPDGDLSDYRLVVVPNLYLLRAEAAENLERFVEAGGVLAVSFWSGVVDERDHVWPSGYAGPLQRLLGVRVEEVDIGRAGAIVTEDGGSFGWDGWRDVIELGGAESIAGHPDGSPAVTRHRFGLGVAYYLGTHAEDAYVRLLVERACAEAELVAPLAAPAGVEIVRREHAERSFLFALNHGDEPVELALPGPAVELMSGETVDRVRLEPLGVAVVEEALVAPATRR